MLNQRAKIYKIIIIFLFYFEAIMKLS